MQIQELDPDKKYIVSVNNSLVTQEDLLAIKEKLRGVGVDAVVMADECRCEASSEILIGNPPQTPAQWLRQYATANEQSAEESFWPWRRAKFRTRAAAFRQALELVTVKT